MNSKKALLAVAAAVAAEVVAVSVASSLLLLLCRCNDKIASAQYLPLVIIPGRGKVHVERQLAL